jgi:hypothetical protein
LYGCLYTRFDPLMTMPPIVKSVVALIVLSMAMVVLQWLAAPVGTDASEWSIELRKSAHPRAARALRRMNDFSILQTADQFCQNTVNAPRNELMRAVPYYGPPTGPWALNGFLHWDGEPTPSLASAGLTVIGRAYVLVLATVFIYLPLVIGGEMMRRDWTVMKVPAQAAALVFLTFIAILSRSSEDAGWKAGVAFGAFSALMLVVAGCWSPRVELRRRVAISGSVLVLCSLIGMFSMSHGPVRPDALSCVVFFGLTFVPLLVGGVTFLLLVRVVGWLLGNLGRRLSAATRAKSPDRI